MEVQAAYEADSSNAKARVVLLSRYERTCRLCNDHIGIAKLVSSGELAPADASKWESINSKLLSLQKDTKELLWYSKRRITRDYASSAEGLGKVPTTGPGEQ